GVAGGLEAVQHGRGRNLPAQVDEVIGTQAIPRHACGDSVGHGTNVAGCEVRILVHPYPESIEDCGDAGSGDLGVVCLQRRHDVPAHLGAREVVSLDVIRVQLHEARDQKVALQILAAGASTFRDLGDAALGDD